MSFNVDILADSISPDEVRLTTLLCVFPRFILAELNTHRMFSRNSASSRAIPPEKQIQRVLDHPFVPVFGSRVTGMGEGRLEEAKQGRAREHWLAARDNAVQQARALLILDVDKSRINRLLEPFMWHTAIVTATEWSNFFALRDNEAAQGEFQTLARMIRIAMGASTPAPLKYDEWHLPLVNGMPRIPIDYGYSGVDPWAQMVKLSVSRCARVSYEKHADEESTAASLERYDKLLASGHLSPFEHPARPARGITFHGNLRGWVSHRAEIPFEYDYSLMQHA